MRCTDEQLSARSDPGTELVISAAHAVYGLSGATVKSHGCSSWF